MILCAFSYDCWKVSKELCSAFQDTGFAYLLNHGIEQHLVQQVVDNSYIHRSLTIKKTQYPLTQAMEKSLEFFSLDEEVKARVSKGPEYQVERKVLGREQKMIVKGWVAQGREIFDQDEGGNIAELEVGQNNISLVQGN